MAEELGGQHSRYRYGYQCANYHESGDAPFLFDAHEAAVALGKCFSACFKMFRYPLKNEITEFVKNPDANRGSSC